MIEMNKKTPIQELIDDLTRRGIFLNPSKTTLLIKRSIDAHLEKEKEFASECFKEGNSYLRCSDANFEQFYSQYNERHGKTN